MYRPAALRHADAASGGGRPLALTRGWVDATYWLLCAIVVATLLFCALADLGEYARGPALVRVDGRVTVTAATAGVIAEVRASPGTRVAAGDVLVRIHDGAERAELAALELEHQTVLAELLREPSRAGARDRLATLVARRDVARGRVAEREVVAPHAGVVADTRIRAGQAVAPGEALLTLEQPDGEPSIVALLPGEYRPLLAVGATAQLELAGFSRSFVDVTIAEIGDEVIGAAEVARFLGPERADAVKIPGAVVVVRATLPAHALEVDGRVYRYFDGMPGQLELRVRSESILTALLPGLRALSRRLGR